MQNLKAALDGANLTFSHIVKCTILLTDMDNFAQVNQVYEKSFESHQFPARICFAVKSLPKDSLVEIDAIAYKP